MDLESKLIILGLNLLLISLPVAFLEIVIEKDKGWGAGHPKDKWYGKIIGQGNPLMKFICGIVGVPYVFGYGLVMYGIIIPVILILEYFSGTITLHLP